MAKKKKGAKNRRLGQSSELRVVGGNLSERKANSPEKPEKKYSKSKNRPPFVSGRRTNKSGNTQKTNTANRRGEGQKSRVGRGKKKI